MKTAREILRKMLIEMDIDERLIDFSNNYSQPLDQSLQELSELVKKKLAQNYIIPERTNVDKLINGVIKECISDVQRLLK